MLRGALPCCWQRTTTAARRRAMPCPARPPSARCSKPPAHCAPPRRPTISCCCLPTASGLACWGPEDLSNSTRWPAASAWRSGSMAPSMAHCACWRPAARARRPWQAGCWLRPSCAAHPRMRHWHGCWATRPISARSPGSMRRCCCSGAASHVWPTPRRVSWATPCCASPAPMVRRRWHRARRQRTSTLHCRSSAPSTTRRGWCGRRRSRPA